MVRCKRTVRSHIDRPLSLQPNMIVPSACFRACWLHPFLSCESVRTGSSFAFGGKTPSVASPFPDGSIHLPSFLPSFLRTGLSSFLPRTSSDPSACVWIRSFVVLPRHLSFSRHLRLSTTTTSRSPSRNGRSRIHGSIFSFALPREPGIEPGSTGSDARSNPGSRPTAPSDGDPETSHGWDEGTPSKHEHDRTTKIRRSTRRHGAKRSVETHGQSARARRRCVEGRKGGSERRVEGKREGRWERGRSDRSRENNTRQRELE